MGSIFNNIGELKSVDQLNPGITILLFFSLFVCTRVAKVNNIEEEPEFTNTEYFEPIFFDHFFSNSSVNFPLVNLGIGS
jgi:hypothetical protein